MGAACCRCQHLDDPLLSLPRVSAAAMSANLNQFYVPAPSASSSSSSLASSSSSSSSSSAASSSSVGQSLASYVSFPFPFVSKPQAAASQAKRSRSKAAKQPHAAPSDAPPRAAAAAPYVGEHWRRTSRGRFAPLTLLELGVRSLCAQLLVHQQDALRDGALPPELAASVLQWLKTHYVLDKPQFQALAPFLLLGWDLADQQELEDSWFDGVPPTTLQQLKSIDVSGCIHLQQLGSGDAAKLPELLVASFQGCTGLTRESIEALQFSTKLTALNLSGCTNVDDKSMKALKGMEHLTSLQLVGCRKLTDKGIKHLSKMTVLEKLRIARCRKLTDGAFEEFAAQFPNLRELDVANCRLSEKALQHIGHIKSLEVLVIRGCQDICDDGMASLSDLINLKYFDARHCSKIHSIPTEWTQLQVLLLGYTAFAEPDAAVLQYLTKLQELELRKCRIMKRGFQFISRLKSLERLELSETALTDSGLLEICNGSKTLKALNISNTEVSDNGAAGLAKLKELRILRLDTPGITNRALANLSFLARLERLDLFSANITDNGLMHLVPLHQLQELTICGGNIGDRGVGLISKLTSLTSLNLSQNRNIRTKSLFYLRALTGLRCLNLSNTGISALSLRHLSPLKELQFLSVYGCSLSQGHIDVLREILPELKCLRCT